MLNKFQNNFFGSKLNTVLLFILIVMMGFALRFMYQDKDKYIYSPFIGKDNITGGEVENSVGIDKSKILGNKDDLISFSIWPNSKVHGVVSYRGGIKNNYFFEANIRINVLDMNKKVLKSDFATATTEWMTSGPVSFEGSFDFSGLPKGPAYFEIQNDNPSGLPENDKSILIPIVVE